jgi:hypothetical protein
MIFILITLSGLIYAKNNIKKEKENEINWISPDKKILVYSLRTGYLAIHTNNTDVDVYRILLLKLNNVEDCGICLAQAKYFDVYWSSNSRYLAIFKSYLTHNTDIDVYKIDIDEKKQSISLNLIYSRSSLGNPPETVWINWRFISWNLDRSILNIVENNENVKYSEEEKHIAVNLKNKPTKTIRYNVDFQK